MESLLPLINILFQKLGRTYPDVTKTKKMNKRCSSGNTINYKYRFSETILQLDIYLH